MHFTDDVIRIRDEIIEFNPSVILHELYEDDKDFFTNLGFVIKPLEHFSDCSFEQREQNMLIRILEYSKYYDHISIIVGDTHLRSYPVDDLGASCIYETFKDDPKVEILRSPHREVL